MPLSLNLIEDIYLTGLPNYYIDIPFCYIYTLAGGLIENRKMQVSFFSR